MPKIGKRSNSGTLCVSLDPAMIGEGYIKGLKAIWIKENGQWILKLANGASINVPVDNTAQGV